MNQKNNHILNEEQNSSRHARGNGHSDDTSNGRFDGFDTRFDRFMSSVQNYIGNSKVMLASSFSHLRNPITIAVIFLLIGVYILLGIIGTIEFSFYSNKVVQYITTNLDIIVNAVLGFFFGPVTACISVTLCTIVRMIAERSGFFIGYVIAASVAGFLHGWILYRHKIMWFGTRFRGFFTDILAKSFVTRFSVSVFINIFLKALIFKLFFRYPIYEYIMHYEKSGVELTSISEFFGVFIVNLLFETAIIFLGLVVVNFVVMKAFPEQFSPHSTVLVNGDGTIVNVDEEMIEEMF